MCFCIPNNEQCRNFITSSHTCPAVIRKISVCQSLHKNNAQDILIVETLIEAAISEERTHPPSLHQQQARLALSDLN